MAGPINWQNVGQYSLADAGRPLEAAQRSFNGAFDGIGGILKEREALNNKNFEVAKVNNTNSYLNQVAELGKTPEALQRAMQDGTLDKIRASLGPNIDQNAIRGAAESLLDQRFKQVKQATDFNNFMTDEKQAPIRDAVGSLIAQGKTQEAQALLQQHQLRNEAALYQGLDARGQVDVERGRATTKFGWDGEDQKAQMAKAADDLLTNRSQRAASAASIANGAASLGLQRDRMTMETEDRKESRLDKIAAQRAVLRSELGDLYGKAATSSGGRVKIQEMITGTKDSNLRANMARILPELLAQPNATTDGVMLGLSTIETSDWLNMDSTFNKRAVEITNQVSNSVTASDQKAANDARRKLIEDSKKDLDYREAKISGNKSLASKMEARLLEEAKLNPVRKKDPQGDRD